MNKIGLITLERAKLELGIPAEETTYDELIQLYIDTVSAAVEKITGRTFESTVYTDEDYTGTATTILLTRNYPIISIEKIELSGHEIDDFELKEKNLKSGKIYRSSKWPISAYSNPLNNVPHGSELQHTENISIDYTAGYAEIPLDVQQKVAEEVYRMYNKAYQTGRVKSWKLGNGSESIDGNEIDPESGFLTNNANYLIKYYKSMVIL